MVHKVKDLEEDGICSFCQEHYLECICDFTSYPGSKIEEESNKEESLENNLPTMNGEVLGYIDEEN